LHIRFIPKQMKRGATLCPGLREHKRAVGKIEGRKIVSPTEFRSDRPPVKPSCNHQVQHHPDTVIELDGNPLSNPPQRANGVALHSFNRWLDRPQ
jgi:hypothetical protein